MKSDATMSTKEMFFRGVAQTPYLRVVRAVATDARECSREVLVIRTGGRSVTALRCHQALRRGLAAAPNSKAGDAGGTQDDG